MTNMPFDFYSLPKLSPEEWNDLCASDSPFPDLSSIPEPETPCAPAPSAPIQPLPILKYNTLAAAETAAFSRLNLNPRDDDLAMVESNPHPYIRTLIAAFSAPTIFLQNVTPEEQYRWHTFQTDHVAKIQKKCSTSPDLIELSAWLVFGAIIEVHKKGVKNGKRSSLRLPKTSAHIAQIAQVIADYAIIRWDVVRFERMEELVVGWREVVKRKINNFNGNWNKKTRGEDLSKAQEVGKKKRKRTSDFPEIQQDSHATASPVVVLEESSPAEMPPSAKKQRVVSVEVEAVPAAASPIEILSSSPEPEIDIFEQVPVDFLECCTTEYFLEGMAEMGALEMFGGDE